MKQTMTLSSEQTIREVPSTYYKVGERSGATPGRGRLAIRGLARILPQDFRNQHILPGVTKVNLDRHHEKTKRREQTNH